MTDGRIISFVGLVERLGGHLVLVIPLDEGGRELQRVARGIGDVEDENLKIVIPGWLGAQFNIREGNTVSVDNRDGKLNIKLHPPL